uniref:Armadillo repeat-containing domain-containing protein n=1 Tax=Haptolina brevifila TaxID=156173 RepID=A0A7S2MZW1_9EUKA|mmetsp:Transcript_6284/g.13051  ORF Transcript_6284/g.13051 Transcript_6284/m.13051 type:complete len:445 (+) Transcript_6284:94-1428(+)
MHKKAGADNFEELAAEIQTLHTKIDCVLHHVTSDARVEHPIDRSRHHLPASSRSSDARRHQPASSHSSTTHSSATDDASNRVAHVPAITATCDLAPAHHAAMVAAAAATTSTAGQGHLVRAAEHGHALTNTQPLAHTQPPAHTQPLPVRVTAVSRGQVKPDGSNEAKEGADDDGEDTGEDTDGEDSEAEERTPLAVPQSALSPMSALSASMQSVRHNLAPGRAAPGLATHASHHSPASLVVKALVEGLRRPDSQDDAEATARRLSDLCKRGDGVAFTAAEAREALVTSGGVDVLVAAMAPMMPSQLLPLAAMPSMTALCLLAKEKQWHSAIAAAGAIAAVVQALKCGNASEAELAAGTLANLALFDVSNGQLLAAFKVSSAIPELVAIAMGGVEQGSSSSLGSVAVMALTNLAAHPELQASIETTTRGAMARRDGTRQSLSGSV